LVGLLAFAPASSSQEPAAPPRASRAAADRLLDEEDPVAARAAWREIHSATPDLPAGLLGLGRVHLMLGDAHSALRYAEAALQVAPDDQDGMALHVRALIRGRAFEAAVAVAADHAERAATPLAELLAARASALFRMQRIDESAEVYRRVLLQDQSHAEAHLRLGSGLSAPRPAPVGARLHAAVRALRAGDLGAAEQALVAELAANPGHPIAHRLLGETLFQRRAAASMAQRDPAFRTLCELLVPVDVSMLPVAEFVPAYAELSPARRAVVDRAVAWFGRRLGRLLAIGGRHDLLAEVERTTDAEPRRPLRSKRTFDGRVWDDVRGIGGLRAATGIEALDEAAQFGFDTLVHELAHQVHYYGLSPLERAKIRELYQRRKQQGEFLDYYAATNEAEYFGQGVEAFAALQKRPACEATHGHTRFELFRVDRDLHDLIASLVDVDPLRDAARARPVLIAAIAAALRSGRMADAVVAAGMLPAGPERERLVRAAEQALALAGSW
jgi:tetratricopeptide (TPR) repeat protein